MIVKPEVKLPDRLRHLVAIPVATAALIVLTACNASEPPMPPNCMPSDSDPELLIRTAIAAESHNVRGSRDFVTSNKGDKRCLFYSGTPYDESHNIFGLNTNNWDKAKAKFEEFKKNGGNGYIKWVDGKYVIIIENLAQKQNPEETPTASSIEGNNKSASGTLETSQPAGNLLDNLKKFFIDHLP